MLKNICRPSNNRGFREIKMIETELVVYVKIHLGPKNELK
jgi:hypothetical protein